MFLSSCSARHCAKVFPCLAGESTRSWYFFSHCFFPLPIPNFKREVAIGLGVRGGWCCRAKSWIWLKTTYLLDFCKKAEFVCWVSRKGRGEKEGKGRGEGEWGQFPRFKRGHGQKVLLVVETKPHSPGSWAAGKIPRGEWLFVSLGRLDPGPRFPALEKASVPQAWHRSL